MRKMKPGGLRMKKYECHECLKEEPCILLLSEMDDKPTCCVFDHRKIAEPAKWKADWEDEE